MKYIFLDTCIIVDCAYSRVEKSAPSLLNKVLKACDRDGVKHLVPEVVLLELDKASEQASDKMFEALKSVEDAVTKISQSGILGGRHLKDLHRALKVAKHGIKEDVRTSLECVKTTALEPSRAERIDIAESDVVEAIKIAIAQKKPAKTKTTWGLLQGDCLIVVGLARFMKDHPDDELVLCSSNVDDFGQKKEGLVGLHPVIAERLGSIAYYTNPTEMLKGEIDDIEDAEKKEIEELGESFERVSGSAWSDRYPRVAGVAQVLQSLMTDQNLGIDLDIVMSDMPNILVRLAGVIDSVAESKTERLLAPTGSLANADARLSKKDPRLYYDTSVSIEGDEWAGVGAEESTDVPIDGADDCQH